MQRNKRYYILKGAHAFFCGKHIAVYGHKEIWQQKAKIAGDKLARRFVFGEVQPGYDKIKNFHNSILKDKNRLEKIKQLIIDFEASL